MKSKPTGKHRRLKLHWGRNYILSHVCGDYIRRVLDWQLDLLDTLTVTLNYGVYTLHSQFTTVLAESSYCVFTGCPSSNTVGSVHLQLFSEDCYFTVDSRLGNSTHTPRPTDWRSARILTLLYSEDSLSATRYARLTLGPNTNWLQPL
jgi:hypothetical protein